MDLALYGRVLWRFRAIFMFGLLLAVTLFILSMVRVSPNGLEYRDEELWQNASTLFITQQGFPEGRALFPPAEEPTTGKKANIYPYADIGRFTSLVDLYSQLANSDPVKQDHAEGRSSRRDSRGRSHPARQPWRRIPADRHRREGANA